MLESAVSCTIVSGSAILGVRQLKTEVCVSGGVRGWMGECLQDSAREYKWGSVVSNTTLLRSAISCVRR